MSIMKQLLQYKFITASIYGLIIYSFLLINSCSFSTKTVALDQCTVLQVEKGMVIDPVDASGIVEPGSEAILRCPYPSIIKQIVREPGSRVEKGDLILLLDDQPIRDEIEKLNDQLEIKHNSLEKNNLAETSTKIDLKYNEEVKKLNITSLKSQLSDEEQLLEVGGISPAKIEKTKQEIALAEKELVMLKEKNSIRTKQLKAEDEGLLLGIEIQEKELKEKLEILSQMKVLAPSSGIVLAIGNKVNEKVNKDQMLVRMSDLSTFKISGFIDEKMADYIKTGTTAYALVDNDKLPGHIGNVSPVVENGKIQFNVYLDQNNHPKLIPNQNIALMVAKEQKYNSLRIKNIPEFGKEKIEVLYLYKNGKAIRQQVKTGFISPEFIEIISGVNGGDQIIVPKSGISKFKNFNEVVINN
jgi:HlyD family secretion protein